MKRPILLGVLLAAAGPAGAGERAGSIRPRRPTSSTTRARRPASQCHQEQAESFFHSQHYQWQGDTPDIVNANGQKLGKINTMNDFCTNPMANWIGARSTSTGRSWPRVLEVPRRPRQAPDGEMTSEEQLENIDCLICHASGYRRDLYENDAGGWQWRPILWQNQVRHWTRSRSASRCRTRAMCLRCHAGAGGGPNFKRGDIEYALADCDRDFDVHMATDGADMQCIACHAGENHRVRGRGADLSGTDFPANAARAARRPSATARRRTAARCSTSTPQRVTCTVCHIRDVRQAAIPRTWCATGRSPIHISRSNKYSATISSRNGRDAGLRLVQRQDPRCSSWASASRSSRRRHGRDHDPRGSAARTRTPRSTPFKLHRARAARASTTSSWIIPLAVEEFFANGDIDQAVHEGGQVAYGIEDPKYAWVQTSATWASSTGSSRRRSALQCLDCHAADGRLDWKALGYRGDPLEKVID